MFPRLLLGLILSAIAAAAPHAAAAPDPAAPVVLWRSVLPTSAAAPAWCDGAGEGVRSQAMPLIGVDPADPSHARATWSLHGERLQATGESRDGGRTWTAGVLDAATSCAAGAPERHRSLNALFDVGAGGRGWLGESWISDDTAPSAGGFRFGGDVQTLAGPIGAGAPPAARNDAQNLAVAASPSDPDDVAVAWTAFDQVPNPVTYLPLRTHVRFARSLDGGRSWSAPVLVHTAPVEQAVINTRLVRTDGGAFVVLFDRARLADLPVALTGAGRLTVSLHASRSTDARTFSPAVALGTADSPFATRPDSGPAPGLSGSKPDLAAGPGGTVVALWHDSSRRTLRLARSRDDGATWERVEDAVPVPAGAHHAAVAVDGRSRTGLFWYDFSADRPDDQSWSLTPRIAVESTDGRWAESALDAKFDLGAAEACEGGPAPLPQQCRPGSHAGPLGVSQDLEGLPSGFLAAYTTAGHLARDGFTDAVVARVR